MIYRFKCKVTGDVLMTGPAGDELLRVIGITPGAKGIIEAVALPAAVRALESAVAHEEAGREVAVEPETSAAAPPEVTDAVTLRQRAWPVLDMMKRAGAAGEAIVWGV